MKVSAAPVRPQARMIIIMFTEKKRVATNAAAMTITGSMRFCLNTVFAILMTTSTITAATPHIMPAMIIPTTRLSRNAL